MKTATKLCDIPKRVRVAACRAVREYAREDSIPRSDCAATVNSLREGVCSGLDWFLLWDSIGTRPTRFFSENEGISELYELAGVHVWGQRMPKGKNAPDSLQPAAATGDGKTHL